MSREIHFAVLDDVPDDEVESIASAIQAEYGHALGWYSVVPE